MKNTNNNKPELLLPAGNIEAFYAAIEGGADAIYLGMKDFNARGRAMNFTPYQIIEIINEAHEKNVKVYITLNTVIKNDEIKTLIDNLHFLANTDVDAVIIQDLGVLNLIKTHFPKINVHASTQMTVVNSVGANFLNQYGIDRVIPARELSLKEVEAMQYSTDKEIEVFVHGALCYSMSGACLFSSYLGGSSANRGECAQACRRKFDNGKDFDFIFNLKDNQLIDHIPHLSDIGISSLKIEGRMRSAEYVYTVASAYRMVLDDHSRLDEAKKLLEKDLGREKTEWFKNNKVSESITSNTATGVLIGEVVEADEYEYTILLDEDIDKVSRLRIISKNGQNQFAYKENLEEHKKGDTILLDIPQDRIIHTGDRVYIAGFGYRKFSSKMNTNDIELPRRLPLNKKNFIANSIKNKDTARKKELFIRIDSLKWLRKIHLKNLDHLIISLNRKESAIFDPTANFLQKSKHKIWIELPLFISELHLDAAKKLYKSYFDAGLKQFFISHISQIDLLPEGSVISTNENVYVYNDAAADLLKQRNIKYHTYPYENDKNNLYDGSDRMGIIPLFYFPKLFYSRQPVKTYGEYDEIFDDTNNSYDKIVRDGFTIVIPEIPTTLFHYKDELNDIGFRRYLIDLSFVSPGNTILDKILNRFYYGEQLQPGSSFNFRNGLK